jgi:sterol 3beta-glucosyltransferase
MDRIDVFAAADVPHAWLFPRMRHIFHHGGAGTTGAAAAAGVPQTAVPYSADQAFWARRISRLGLGPAAPPARRLTASRFEALLAEALSNPLYRQNAIALGEKIRAENGVQVAVDWITILLNSSSSNFQP